MAATADPPETDEQPADYVTEDSSEESDPFDQEVQRYLDEGMEFRRSPSKPSTT